MHITISILNNGNVIVRLILMFQYNINVILYFEKLQ